MTRRWIIPTRRAFSRDGVPQNAKKRCMRLLVSSNGLQSEGVQALERDAQEAGVRVEVADRALERISKKENCFAAMVYKRRRAGLMRTARTSCSTTPATAAIWARSCARRSALVSKHRDHPPGGRFDDPRVVRASMGAAFSLNVRHFDSFDQYRAQYPLRRLFRGSC